MFTAMLFPITGCLALAVTPEAKQLRADVAAALSAAQISLTAAAVDCQTTVPKLSEQVNGDAPLTLLWRMLVTMPAFSRELQRIRAERHGQAVVSRDLSTVVEAVERIERRMLKVHLSAEQREGVA